MNQKIKIRIAKYLADSGIASRRKAEDIILAGRVKVNGEILKDLAYRVDVDTDKVKVDNKDINQAEKVYYLLNKPKGFICSVKDPHNSQTVLSLVPKDYKLFPVGRLDKDSQGLLLLTNDGDLAYQLTHPKFEIHKTYLVKVNKNLANSILADLKKGVRLEEGLAKADKVKILNNKELEITIHQGWKRQIRRMLDELGYKVLDLIRISEGKLNIKDLMVGEYKKISKGDIV